jgi:hypothetical protein
VLVLHLPQVRKTPFLRAILNNGIRNGSIAQCYRCDYVRQPYEVVLYFMQAGLPNRNHSDRPCGGSTRLLLSSIIYRPDRPGAILCLAFGPYLKDRLSSLWRSGRITRALAKLIESERRVRLSGQCSEQLDWMCIRAREHLPIAQA